MENHSALGDNHRAGGMITMPVDKADHVLSQLARRKFRFKKELGQNFLFNDFALRQIVDSAGIKPGDFVVEVGAGAGSLTRAIADKRAKVVAVELDRTLIPFLNELFRDEPDVRVARGDIMKMDIDTLIASVFDIDKDADQPVPYKICANLPYNISTAFVTRAFRELRRMEAGAVLVQKEVADKITARPGQESYGPLSLAASWYGEVRQAFDLGPEYFTPAPPVFSTLVTFKRERERFTGVNERILWTIIRSLFNKRRKTALSGLRSIKDISPREGASWADVLDSAGIDRARRPETISLDEFALIAAACAERDAANAEYGAASVERDGK